MKNKLSVGLYTLGCKVSQYETEAVAEEFLRRGYSVAPFDTPCDAYVINTCTVTAESDRKSRQIIRRARKMNPAAKVGVIGCYSQRAPGEVWGVGADAVLGTHGKMGIVDLIDGLLTEGTVPQRCDSFPLSDVPFEKMKVERAPRTRAYVKIEDGCESKCTYCAIAPARGRVRSKEPCDVIAEVEDLYRAGTREIVLTGIETGSYGRDLEEGCTLADLIVTLDRRHSCDRIRLGSLAPELVGAKFVEKVKDVTILAPHFHLSMQSGSDKILASMKRRYNTAMAYDTIARLREAFPTAQITTDLMVGFPGETEEDFLLSCDFVRRARLLDAHVFAYSRREGTEAYSYSGQIPDDVKRERSARLIAVKNEVRDSVLDDVVRSAEPLSAILELYKDGRYSAHSDGYVEISAKGRPGMQGELVKVMPTSHENGIVYGDIVD